MKIFSDIAIIFFMICLSRNVFMILRNVFFIYIGLSRKVFMIIVSWNVLICPTNTEFIMTSRKDFMISSNKIFFHDIMESFHDIIKYFLISWKVELMLKRLAIGSLYIRCYTLKVEGIHAVRFSEISVYRHRNSWPHA